MGTPRTGIGLVSFLQCNPRSVNISRNSHLFPIFLSTKAKSSLPRKYAMTNTFLKNTRELVVKARMPKGYQLINLTDACHAHAETGSDLCQVSVRKERRPLTIKELERRRKISESKKGSIPWNKGKKHSEETIQRIRQKMLEVLSDPKVRKKMKGMQGTHSQEVKELISAKQKQVWSERRKRKPNQDKLHRNWAEIIAATARIGGYGEKELDWDSYDKIKAELISEAEKQKQKEMDEREKKRKKVRDEILERIKERKAAEKGEERKEKTGMAKMRTPTKSKIFVKKRLTKLHMWKKRLETSSNSKEVVPDRIGDEWDIEVTKERLDIGISLLDQLQLVKDARKNEQVLS